MVKEVSLWEIESYYAPKNITIIGSGFVGLWSAYFIKKKNPKYSVTILDRGIIPTGASTRNAGFACFGSLTELLADSQTMGEEKMLDLVQKRFKGLQKIQKIFSKDQLGLECFGGYELITADQGYSLERIRSEIDTINRKLKPIVGIAKTFHLADHKIEKLGLSNVSHLIENTLEAQLHSGKFCESLSRLVRSMGVDILYNIEISGYQIVNGKVQIQSNLPVPLNSDKILICTNGFARTLLPDLDVEPARGQVLVTGPLSVNHCKGTFHYDEGFYYFRNVGNRILLGGARNKFLKNENTSAIEITQEVQNELEIFLSEKILAGKSYTIDYRWSGIMAMGKEKKPIVKKINDQVYCAVRMSGMGVALAPEIGRQVEKLLSGIQTDCL